MSHSGFGRRIATAIRRVLPGALKSFNDTKGFQRFPGSRASFRATWGFQGLPRVRFASGPAGRTAVAFRRRSNHFRRVERVPWLRRGLEAADSDSALDVGSVDGLASSRTELAGDGAVHSSSGPRGQRGRRSSRRSLRRSRPPPRRAHHGVRDGVADGVAKPCPDGAPLLGARGVIVGILIVWQWRRTGAAGARRQGPVRVGKPLHRSRSRLARHQPGNTHVCWQKLSGHSLHRGLSGACWPPGLAAPSDRVSCG
jgi:hypothetical protein